MKAASIGIAVVGVGSGVIVEGGEGPGKDAAIGGIGRRPEPWTA